MNFFKLLYTGVLFLIFAMVLFGCGDSVVDAVIITKNTTAETITEKESSTTNIEESTEITTKQETTKDETSTKKQNITTTEKQTTAQKETTQTTAKEESNSEIKKKEDLLEILKSEKVSLEQELSSAEKSVTRVEDYLNEYQGKLETLNKDLAKIRESGDEEQINYLTNEIAKCTTAIAKYMSDYNKAVNYKNSRVAMLEAVEKRITETEKELIELKK
ncbi:MAG: hypothetical protein IJM97_00905 [Clostridia bacterium]|nr:hypothetical protein [Clostridia bacterium]